MKEMIYKQDAIDAINRCRDDYDLARQEQIDDCENAVRELTAVEERTGHWIPCSKKMPEEHEWIGTKKFGTTISDEVYVTFENEKGERFCKHLSFQNGKLSSYDQSHIDVWYKGSKPIAWMPLPEAYRKDGETE